MKNELLSQAKQKMSQALEHLEGELAALRTNRAQPALVEEIKVEHYGQQLPIKALANIAAPDAKTLSITAWDPTAVGAIERALAQNEALGVNPLSDGKVIHINIPPLTQERRELLSKQIGEKVEAANIAMRNARHDALGGAKTAQQDKAISEDDYHQLQKELDALIEEHRSRANELATAKKADIMSV